MTTAELTLRLFLEVVAIIAVSRLLGVVLGRILQPLVVSEMITGIVLGPSLFGLLAPGLQQWLFPAASANLLYAVSQLGLVLYMFLVGLEFNVELFRGQVRAAASVSAAGIAAPFALGGALAVLLIGRPGLFGAGTSHLQAVLFMGAAMSVTAFPVLARIVAERGVASNAVGTLSLAAGAISDAFAWSILAILLAMFANSAGVALLTIAGGAAYTVAVLGLGRLAGRAPAVAALLRRLPVILALLLLCAWFTDTIGISSVFGAFVLGVAIPRGPSRDALLRTLSPLVVNLLLPLYFVYSGLHTRVGLIDSWALVAIALAVLLAASVGKAVACWGAAALNRVPARDAMAIGSLMNARGLMELVLLNVGLQRGIITPTLFTIMVLMAIATTVIASPMFELVYRRPVTASAPAPGTAVRS